MQVGSSYSALDVFYSYPKNPSRFSLIEKLKLANGIYTWLQADLLKMKKIWLMGIPLDSLA